MRKTTIIALTMLFFLSSINAIIAQERNRQTIQTSATEINVTELANEDMQLLYPERKSGLIYFSDGNISEYEMNYNFLLDEVHFLTSRGRVHALQRIPSYDKLVIKDRTFIWNNDLGYIELLHEGKNNLYLKRHVNINTLPVSRGAYGTTDHTSRIQQATIEQTAAYQVSEVRVGNPNAQELEITLRYSEYFLFEKDGEKTRVNNHRQLGRLFSDHSSEIRSFARQNNIDFDNPEDMIKMAEFIDSL